MNTDEVKQTARDYFDGAPGLSSDIGFEIVEVSRYDVFEDGEVRGGHSRRYSGMCEVI